MPCTKAGASFIESLGMVTGRTPLPSGAPISRVYPLRWQVFPLGHSMSLLHAVSGGLMRGTQMPVIGSNTGNRLFWMMAQLPCGGTEPHPLQEAAVVQVSPSFGPPAHFLLTHAGPKPVVGVGPGPGVGVAGRGQLAPLAHGSPTFGPPLHTPRQFPPPGAKINGNTTACCGVAVGDGLGVFVAGPGVSVTVGVLVIVGVFVGVFVGVLVGVSDGVFGTPTVKV